MSFRLCWVFLFLLTTSVFVHGKEKRLFPFDLPADRAGTCLVFYGDQGELALEIARRTAYSIYCLNPDRQKASNLREHFDRLGLYGKRITIDVGANDPLPFADYCADIALVDPSRVKNLMELWRVAKPGGNLFMKSPSGKADEIKKKLETAGVKEFEILETKGGWVKIKRLRPKDMDEWSHVNHGPDNDAHSEDRLLKTPLRTQWINSGPLLPCGERSGSKVERSTLTAGGRWFHKREFAGANCLAALDAYDGRLLWTYHEHPRGEEQKPRRWGARSAGQSMMKHLGIQDKKYEEFKKSEKEEEKGLYMRWNAMLNNSVIVSPYVATAEKIYVPYVRKKGCAVLDAATGKELAAFVLPDEPEKKELPTPWQYIAHDGKSLYGAKITVLAALDAVTGKALWQYSGRVATHTIAVGKKNIMFYDYKQGPMALDKQTGEQRWCLPEEADNVPLGATDKPIKKGNSRHFPYVLYRNGAWIVYGGKGIQAFDENDGHTLWLYDLPHVHHYKKKNFFRYGRHYYARFFSSVGEGNRLYVNGVGVVDPVTGKVHYAMKGSGMSCSRVTITRDTFFHNRRGYYINFGNKKGTYYHVRNACGANAGVVGNGMIYVAESGCGCSWVMNANLAFGSAGNFKPKEPSTDLKSRFLRGPAFQVDLQSATKNLKSDDWPCYRHDTLRSGTSSAGLEKEIKPAWTFKGQGEPTSPAIAGDTVFVGSTANRIYALDAQSGKERWRFLTGGPVIATPAWWEGKVYAGSQDGWVYCLDGQTGKLIWAFRGAPHQRKIMVNGTLRSAWSINGGVLIQDSKAYFYAGMMAVDGAYLYCLDARTGKIIWAKQEKNFRPLGRLAASKDLLIAPQGAAGASVFRLKDGTQLKERNFGISGTDPVVWGNLLLCGGKRFDGQNHSAIIGLPAGFRVYMIRSLPGHPAFGGSNAARTSHMSWSAGFAPGDVGFLLATPVVSGDVIFQAGPQGMRAMAGEVVRTKKAGKSLKKTSSPTKGAKWVVKWESAVSDDRPFISLIKAGSQIITARPKAKSGSTLAAYNADNGAPVWQKQVQGDVVNNGLAVARGRLFVSLKHGEILCFAKQKK